MTKTYSYTLPGTVLPASPFLRETPTKPVGRTNKIRFTLAPKAEMLCSACRHPIQSNEPCLFCETLASKRASQKATITRRLAELREMEGELEARAKARGE